MIFFTNNLLSCSIPTFHHLQVLYSLSGLFMGSNESAQHAMICGFAEIPVWITHTVYWCGEQVTGPGKYLKGT